MPVMLSPARERTVSCTCLAVSGAAMMACQALSVNSFCVMRFPPPLPPAAAATTARPRLWLHEACIRAAQQASSAIHACGLLFPPSAPPDRSTSTALWAP